MPTMGRGEQVRRCRRCGEVVVGVGGRHSCGVAAPRELRADELRKWEAVRARGEGRGSDCVMACVTAGR